MKILQIIICNISFNDLRHKKNLLKAYLSTMIKMRYSKKYGRGIYSDDLIKKGSVLFTDQLLVIPKKDVSKVNNSILEKYWFDFNSKNYAIALGLGSLFNHSVNENVMAIIDEKNQVISFKALIDIKPKEQLFLNYGYSLS